MNCEKCGKPGTLNNPLIDANTHENDRKPICEACLIGVRRGPIYVDGIEGAIMLDPGVTATQIENLGDGSAKIIGGKITSAVINPLIIDNLGDCGPIISSPIKSGTLKMSEIAKAPEPPIYSEEQLKKIEQQRGHYLYKQSEELYEAAKERQLIKGALTYSEPLEPDSWSNLQALNHLLEEVVDIKNYATMQYIQNERLTARNKELIELCNELYGKNKMLNEVLSITDTGVLFEENRLLKKKVETLEAQALEAQKQLLKLENLRVKGLLYGR